MDFAVETVLSLCFITGGMLQTLRQHNYAESVRDSEKERAERRRFADVVVKSENPKRALSRHRMLFAEESHGKLGAPRLRRSPPCKEAFRCHGLKEKRYLIITVM